MSIWTRRPSAKGWRATSAAAPAITTSSRPFWRGPRRCTANPPPNEGRNDTMSNSPANTNAPANPSGIGASVKRREDFRFLTGQGTYTDDINRPNQTHAYILRSPYAHARINGIDASAALDAPGVVAVFTGKDIAADKVNGLPCGWQ